MFAESGMRVLRFLRDLVDAMDEHGAGMAYALIVALRAVLVVRARRGADDAGRPPRLRRRT